ncbi:MAG: STAS domain-containing protein [Sumerlaeia bacterium]
MNYALIDFAEVSFLSSMGIRMLLTMARVCGRNGGIMVVLNPQELVLEAMQHASLDEIIPVVESKEEAETHFNS